MPKKRIKSTHPTVLSALAADVSPSPPLLVVAVLSRPSWTILDNIRPNLHFIWSRNRYK